MRFGRQTLTVSAAFSPGALAPETKTAVLSLGRANGKSWLGAHIFARCLTPGDRLYEAGAEYLLCAASIEQARLVFRFIRQALEPTGRYRFLDASTRIGITGPENTRLRVLSSNGRTAQGIVGCPLLLADEPGSWETIGGQVMFDAIQTAQGKPGSPLRVIFIGTAAALAPGASGGWWTRIVTGGSRGSTFVQSLQGDPKKWDHWREILRCNPLTRISAEFRDQLREERDDARHDSQLRARFLSFRLNKPTEDEVKVLITVDDWQRALRRPVPEKFGRSLVALDMGQGRAWSAIVALWPSGRLEARAVAPGLPSLADQEKRDRVPRGTYQRLASAGVLTTDGDLRVPRASEVIRIAMQFKPSYIVCDRARLAEVLDAAAGRVKVVERISQWFEAAYDTRALRKLVKDGSLACEARSRGLTTVSLSAARVQNDTSGNVRMVKRDSANNTARDDVAAALVLVAGAMARRKPARPLRFAVAG